MQQQHAAIHFGKWEKGVTVVGKPQKLLTKKFSWKTTSPSAMPLPGDREEYQQLDIPGCQGPAIVTIGQGVLRLPDQLCCGCDLWIKVTSILPQGTLPYISSQTPSSYHLAGK